LEIGLDTKCDLEEKWHVGCDISKRPCNGQEALEKSLFSAALAGSKEHKEVEAAKKLDPFGIENSHAADL
jgi:hypothetical protein